MKKKVMKKVIGEVIEDVKYMLECDCPYCNTCQFADEIEEDNITIVKKCRECGKDFKVKIPKNSIN